MQNRREFIRKSILGFTAITVFGAFRDDDNDKWEKLTILHTNDMHSRIEPFPEDHPKYAGLGGMARRAGLIKQIRSEEKNVLLLDAGDVFQGTPYFNIYGGELEFKLMSDMGYDAATMGNHDFDNGLEGFDKMLPFADFPFVCTNYNFDLTILKDKTIPYKIVKKGDIKVGIIGIGIELDGLVDKKNYGKTVYEDPIEKVDLFAGKLKNEEDCDFVVCLSHLGYSYDSDKISDKILAKQTENVDFIIGGHTHTFMDKPKMIKNKAGKKVLINQVGWAGINLGRVDFYFKKRKLVQSHAYRAIPVDKNCARI